MRLIFAELKGQLKNVKGTLKLFLTPFMTILIMASLVLSMDPRKLPTAVIVNDHSAFSRSLIASIDQSKDHKITSYIESEAEGRKLMQQGRIVYLITIPTNFSRDLIRGDRPQIIVEVDALVSTKASTLNNAIRKLAEKEFKGALSYLNELNPPFELVIHNRYNPEELSGYKILPGLVGVMFLIVAMLLNQMAFIAKANSPQASAKRQGEKEASAFIVTIATVLPPILIQFTQSFFILFLIVYLYGVPIYGNIGLFIGGFSLYISANILIAYTFSIGAKDISLVLLKFAVIFVPSFIMSGFLFPYYGMPRWAQLIGELLPLRHFLQISRDAIIKASTFSEMWIHIWPLMVMGAILLLGATLRTRQFLKSTNDV